MCFALYVSIIAWAHCTWWWPRRMAKVPRLSWYSAAISDFLQCQVFFPFGTCNSPEGVNKQDKYRRRNVVFVEFCRHCVESLLNGVPHVRVCTLVHMVLIFELSPTARAYGVIVVV